MNNKHSILLSPKHGVNPSLLKCFVCGEDIGIALLGKLKGDKEAPHEIYNGELCCNCKKVIEQQHGAFIIEVKDNTEHKDPERTGRLVGISEECKNRWNIKSPINYMEESMFSKIFDNVEFNNK